MKHVRIDGTFSNKKHVTENHNRRMWVGVDFDDTMCAYDPVIYPKAGKPNIRIIEIVRKHLANKMYDVKIFTARQTPEEHDEVNKTCLELFGRTLPITNFKDFGLLYFYDDRAVSVSPDTGHLYHYSQEENPYEY